MWFISFLSFRDLQCFFQLMELFFPGTMWIYSLRKCSLSFGGIEMGRKYLCLNSVHHWLNLATWLFPCGSFLSSLIISSSIHPTTLLSSKSVKASVIDCLSWRWCRCPKIIGYELSFFLDFPDDNSGKESPCQFRRCKRCGFNPWVRKIP